MFRAIICSTNHVRAVSTEKWFDFAKDLIYIYKYKNLEAFFFGKAMGFLSYQSPNDLLTTIIPRHPRLIQFDLLLYILDNLHEKHQQANEVQCFAHKYHILYQHNNLLLFKLFFAFGCINFFKRIKILYIFNEKVFVESTLSISCNLGSLLLVIYFTFALYFCTIENS